MTTRRRSRRSPTLRLDWCSHAAARYATKHWHYSTTMPTPPLVKIGAWEDDRFIGVVLFSRGSSNNLGRPYKLKADQVCELTRVALDRHETPTSRIVAIAIRMLRSHAPGLRLIVSFADANEGHVGTLYQAGGWVYAGRTQPTEVFFDQKGRKWHSRQLSSTGVNVQYGSVRRVPRRDECRRVKQLGKYRYLMPLDETMRRRVEHLRKPNPAKSDLDEELERSRAGSGSGDTPVLRAGKGGSIPTPALQSSNVKRGTPSDQGKRVRAAKDMPRARRGRGQTKGESRGG